MAIFGTDTALRVAQNTDLHSAAEGGLTHLQRRGKQRRQVFVGTIKYRARLRALQFFAGEHSLNHPIQIKFPELQHLVSPQVDWLKAGVIFA